MWIRPLFLVVLLALIAELTASGHREARNARGDHRAPARHVRPAAAASHHDARSPAHVNRNARAQPAAARRRRPASRARNARARPAARRRPASNARARPAARRRPAPNARARPAARQQHHPQNVMSMLHLMTPRTTRQRAIMEGKVCGNKAGNCDKLQGFCTVATYVSILTKYCTMQCGACAPLGTDCKDNLGSKCHSMQRNGFCHSRFFGTAMKRVMCAKTCGLCGKMDCKQEWAKYEAECLPTTCKEKNERMASACVTYCKKHEDVCGVDCQDGKNQLRKECLAETCKREEMKEKTECLAYCKSHRDLAECKVDCSKKVFKYEEECLKQTCTSDAKELETDECKKWCSKNPSEKACARDKPKKDCDGADKFEDECIAKTCAKEDMRGKDECKKYCQSHKDLAECKVDCSKEAFKYDDACLSQTCMDDPKEKATKACIEFCKAHPGDKACAADDKKDCDSDADKFEDECLPKTCAKEENKKEQECIDFCKEDKNKGLDACKAAPPPPPDCKKDEFNDACLAETCKDVNKKSNQKCKDYCTDKTHAAEDACKCDLDDNKYQDHCIQKTCLDAKNAGQPQARECKDWCTGHAGDEACKPAKVDCAKDEFNAECLKDTCKDVNKKSNKACKDYCADKTHAAEDACKCDLDDNKYQDHCIQKTCLDAKNAGQPQAQECKDWCTGHGGDEACKPAGVDCAKDEFNAECLKDTCKDVNKKSNKACKDYCADKTHAAEDACKCDLDDNKYQDHCIQKTCLDAKNAGQPQAQECKDWCTGHAGDEACKPAGVDCAKDEFNAACLKDTCKDVNKKSNKACKDYCADKTHAAEDACKCDLDDNKYQDHCIQKTCLDAKNAGQPQSQECKDWCTGHAGDEACKPAAVDCAKDEFNKECLKDTCKDVNKKSNKACKDYCADKTHAAEDACKCDLDDNKYQEHCIQKTCLDAKYAGQAQAQECKDWCTSHAGDEACKPAAVDCTKDEFNKECLKDTCKDVNKKSNKACKDYCADKTHAAEDACKCDLDDNKYQDHCIQKTCLDAKNAGQAQAQECKDWCTGHAGDEACKPAKVDCAKDEFNAECLKDTCKDVNKKSNKACKDYCADKTHAAEDACKCDLDDNKYQDHCIQKTCLDAKNAGQAQAQECKDWCTANAGDEACKP